jgi:hypothetical protein
MYENLKVMLYHIAVVAVAMSAIGCASKGDLDKLRDELLNNAATARSSMEHRLGRTTTQIDVRKQQETATFQSQFNDLQQQLVDFRQGIEESNAMIDGKFQTLDQVLTEVLLIEQNELNNRLKAVDKSLKDLEKMSPRASKRR